MAAAQCGEPLICEDWKGWPLRLARFPAQGSVEAVHTAEDSVLVWGGGKSTVAIACGSDPIEWHRFVRHAGMIDLLPGGTLLREIHWQGEPCEYVSVSFDAPSVERILGKKLTFAPYGLRTALTDAHVVDLVRRLQSQALAAQPWGSLYVEGLSLALASYVYGKYASRPEPTSAEQPLSTQQSEQVVAFVEERLADNISLVDLAALIGYSPDHFARLFKRAFGLSPHQYLLDRRVERAKSLLRSNTHSLVEVAVLCGFGSQAHLQTVFKARTGITPGAYRKS